MLMYYNEHLSVPLWLCLYPAPPSTHLSLSIQPLYHTTASQVPNYL